MNHSSIIKPLFLSVSLMVIFLFGIKNAHAQDSTAYRSDTLHLSFSGTFIILSIGGGVEYPFKQSSIGFKISYTYFLNSNKYHYLEYKYYSSHSAPGKHFYYGVHLAQNFTEYSRWGLFGEQDPWKGQWYRSRSLLAGPLFGFRLYNYHQWYWDIFFGLNVGYRWGIRRWDHYEPDSWRLLSRQYEKDSSFKYGARIGVSLGLQFYRNGFFKKKVD